MPTPMEAPDWAYQDVWQRNEASLAQHYENFPVASWLLPKKLRRAVAIIYIFARSADDFADEHPDAPSYSLRQLSLFRNQLNLIEQAKAVEDPYFQRLQQVITEHALPIEYFHALLDAFVQDVRKKRYADDLEVLDYCKRSANPIGRILLHLHGSLSAENLVYSDAICTALQLINFYQDLQPDYQENRRIYIPQDDLHTYGVSEKHFKFAIADIKMHLLMQKQYRKAYQLLRKGLPLGASLRGRFGLEIRCILNGGFLILEALHRQGYHPFQRPRLRAFDWIKIFFNALLYRFPNIPGLS